MYVYVYIDISKWIYGGQIRAWINSPQNDFSVSAITNFLF